MKINEQKDLGNLRIHGDNIIEAERTLHLLAEALNARISLIGGPAYLLKYELRSEDGIVCNVQLFSGHDRWGVNIQEVLTAHGAPLREATDAVVTRLVNGRKEEEIVFALEYSNALPAGNNAWQRMGRALACASAGVAYLYYADLGGVELDGNRNIKAPRFPNPIIPFAYITTGVEYGSISIPIYVASPSSSQKIRDSFDKVFGYRDGVQLVGSLLLGKVDVGALKRLRDKALLAVQILANSRARVDTLRGEQWTELLGLRSAKEKAKWLEGVNGRWNKKSSGKVQTTKTFDRLPSIAVSSGSISVGANEIPISLLPADARKKFSVALELLYGSNQPEEFFRWLSSSDSPLVLVWITGFKPEGEDSRPDRGLVPMARMLFGNEVDILSIVSGPAKPQMWRALESSPEKLATQNGLWEAIVNLSNGILIDSATAPENPMFYMVKISSRPWKERIRFTATGEAPDYSEHDVDSVLHFLFTGANSEHVFECMCNPPGGDWSGLSFLDVDTNREYRWTSLPRVSSTNGKRPDHVVQIRNGMDSILLSIESKTNANSLEVDVGTRLNQYTSDLIEVGPTIERDGGVWKLSDYGKGFMEHLTFVSGGAFCWSGLSDMDASMRRGSFDLVLGVEFGLKEEKTLLHIKANQSGHFVVKIISDLCKRLAGRIEVQVH